MRNSGGPSVVGTGRGWERRTALDGNRSLALVETEFSRKTAETKEKTNLNIMGVKV
jgi:hypothetical protein